MVFRLTYNLKLKIQKNIVLTAAAVCILFLSFSKAERWCPPNKKIICPCGEKGNLISVPCDPKLRDRNEPCEKFRFCETCSDILQTCSSCPPGYFGPDCTQLSSEGASQNISNSITRNFRRTEKIRSKRSINCPNLQSPKLGTIRCRFGNNEKSCTGRCLPSHYFEAREDNEIVLHCVKNRWVPISSFPPCVSDGKCDLEMKGAGSYNCTTDIRGTFCDIHCLDHQRVVRNRHFCYPGRAWSPRLPYCIRNKRTGNERKDCRCQNGGTCDYERERCLCLANFEGPFCERYKYISKASCYGPGHFPYGRIVTSNGQVTSGNGLYEEDETLIYSCRNGYALVGSSLLTCLRSATWSSNPPICRKIQAGTKPTTATTTTTVKPEEKIFCSDPGFIPNGNRWTTAGRESIEGDIFEAGHSVVFSCKNGYALVGLSILTCQTSRRWSNILPECTQIENDEPTYCPDPGTDPNALRIEKPWIDAKKKPVARTTDEFPEGFKFEYSCKDGYSLQGESTLLCFFPGTWSAPAPTCAPESELLSENEVVYCPDPGTDPNAQRTEEPWIDPKGQTVNRKPNEFPQGFTFKYNCKDGYTILGDSTLRCLVTGAWSALAPTCEPESELLSENEIVYCPDPGTHPKAQRIEEPWINAKRKAVNRKPDEFPQGFKFSYSCEDGYSLLGDSKLICLFDGNWSSVPPTCVAGPLSGELAFCNDFGDIENGNKVVVLPINKKTKETPTADGEIQYPEGIKLEYFCMSGYQLVGTKVLTCLDTGSWSASPPECKRI